MKTPNFVDRHVGKRLRILRLARGFDLQGLAQMLGVSTQRLLQLEDGHERITADMMRKLSRVLNAPPSEFFAGFSVSGKPVAAVPDPLTEEEEEARLLRDFARIRDPKSRALVLALVAAYAEFGDMDGR